MPVRWFPHPHKESPVDKHKQQARRIEAADIKAGQAAAAALRDHPLVKASATLCEVADQPPMVALSTLTAAAGFARSDARLLRTGLRMLAAHALATAAKALIKHKVDRKRPQLSRPRHEHRMKPGRHDEGPHNSFPSGHTAGAMAVASAVAAGYPAGAPVAYGLASAAGAVQIPRGTHFPIDVAAGAAIGLLAGWLVRAGEKRWAPPPAI